MAELHVHLDPVAELRRTRRTAEPEPTAFALASEVGGASGIGAHLRQEGRHVEEADLKVWKAVLRVPLTVVLNTHDEMLKIALALAPARVVLVSERHEERAIGSGLDLLLHAATVQRAARLLREAGVKTLVFMEPDLEQLKGASKAGVDGVLLNALRLSEALGTPREAGEWQRLQDATKVCQKYGLRTGAFRGIGYPLARRLGPLGLDEVHCGHAIASRALHLGYTTAVRDMVALVA